MSQSHKQFVVNYTRIFWQEYGKEFIVFVVTIITVVINALSIRPFIWLDILAIVLLGLYIMYMFYDAYQSTRATVIDINSGYSICLGKQSDFFKDSIRKQIRTLKRQRVNLSKVENHFKIIDVDWQYYDERLSEPTKWSEIVSEISKHFFRYAHRLPISTNLHLFVIAPSPIVMGVGFTIGKHRNWNVYHYTDSTYQLMSSRNTNSFNGDTSSFQHIHVENNPVEGSETTVILSFVPMPNFALPKLTEASVKISPKAQRRTIETDKFAAIYSGSRCQDHDP